MEWKQILSELVGFVKDAAPALWAIYRRQVFVYGIKSLFFSAFFCVTSIKVYRATKDSNDEDIEWLGIFGTFVFVCISVFLFAYGLERLANPDYYVIQMMLMAIGK